MIEKYGVNYFKFDGVGTRLEHEELGPEGLSDIAALLRLIEDLKQMRPDLYINISIGEGASPYWLWYGDSVWRGGKDCDVCGQGSMRQQWINYRDATTHQMVVRRGPLFPLNSVMNQGITFAQLGYATRMGNELEDLVDEFRMFFGDGTQMQELYMTPQMMTPPMWDALAEAAAWRSNADVLVDTHWIGATLARANPVIYRGRYAGFSCNPSNQPNI